MDQLREICRTGFSEYQKTPVDLKILDSFILYAVVTAAVQFLYALLVGTFPFNSFLAGLFCSAGFAVLTVCLRLQVGQQKQGKAAISRQRAFADFALCSGLLFLVSWNFMG